jgi:hypothetical protein
LTSGIKCPIINSCARRAGTPGRCSIASRLPRWKVEAVRAIEDRQPKRSLRVTPAELRGWRLNLGWSTRQAAEEIGLKERAYKYLEQGVTSQGRPRDEIPLLYELAIAELTRRIRRRRPHAA